MIGSKRGFCLALLNCLCDYHVFKIKLICFECLGIIQPLMCLRQIMLFGMHFQKCRQSVDHLMQHRQPMLFCWFHVTNFDLLVCFVNTNKAIMPETNLFYLMVKRNARVRKSLYNPGPKKPILQLAVSLYY